MPEKTLTEKDLNLEMPARVRSLMVHQPGAASITNGLGWGPKVDRGCKANWPGSKAPAEISQNCLASLVFRYRETKAGVEEGEVLLLGPRYGHKCLNPLLHPFPVGNRAHWMNAKSSVYLSCLFPSKMGRPGRGDQKNWGKLL